MAQFRIKGAKSLKGEIKAAGNKNSAVPLIAASLLLPGPVKFTNVPQIRDVGWLIEIVRGLGAEVEDLGGGEFSIDGRGLSSWEPDPELTGKFRASIVLAAPLLARFGKAKLGAPGGDSIGERLVDTHFQLLSSLGIKITEHDGIFEMSGKVNPATVFLDKASVTATELGLILGSTVRGKTVIEDAACEPHIRELAEFLRRAGAQVEGAGTNTVTARGSGQLRGVNHEICPDHIEVGTFAIAAAATDSHVKILGALEEDLKMTLLYLADMGVKYKLTDNVLEVMPSELVAKRRAFHTRPWPGFPTDLMSAFIVLATQTKGTILCHDWMYEWRIFFVDHLIKMGADITIADPHRIIISGPRKLHGETIPTTDIRAGMALVLAGLAARGETIVEHAEIIERGHENLEERLSKIGAEIERTE